MPTPSVELRQVSKSFLDPRSKHLVKAMQGISLAVAEGEFFALLGPSGCGKTTTLRMIAGFEQPDAGEILIRGRPVQGVPAFHRPVNTVFQDYALFPHMSVLQNVMFGLKMAKVPAAEARRRASEALELVQLPHIAQRKPHQLSGGQRQRIALARALVNRPAVLLLDEPLGALDLKLRKAMQLELKRMQQQVGITFIFVTHDQEEAMTMAERIAVMSEGRVLQLGTPSEIYEHPANRFVADFIGETNFVEGELVAVRGNLGEVRLGGGRVIAAALDGHALAPGEPVTVAIRPERIRLEPGRAVSDEAISEVAGARGLTQLAGTVREVHYVGTDTRYHVDVGGASLAVRRQNLEPGFAERYRVGQEVVVSWRSESASILR